MLENRQNMPELEAALWLYSKPDFDDGLVRDAALAIRELTEEYLSLCEGKNCAGDRSAGFAPCWFHEFPDGCRLKKDEDSPFFKAMRGELK